MMTTNLKFTVFYTVIKSVCISKCFLRFVNNILSKPHTVSRKPLDGIIILFFKCF